MAYDGAGFHGWQVQPGVRTVEGELAAAVELMARRPIKVWGASRTDAGVHALGQVAAFDDPGTHAPEAWYRALNRNTGDGLVVRAVYRVPATFHPRHDARGKIYHYRIVEGFHALPHLSRTSIREPSRLDVEAMHAAAQRLVGEHDFSAFRGVGCDASSPVRRLYGLRVERRGECVRVEVVGSAFLKYMVRIIVGTLLEVGRGRRDAGWVGGVLAGRDRAKAGMTAPPEGLTLARIFHPDLPLRDAAGAERCRWFD